MKGLISNYCRSEHWVRKRSCRCRHWLKLLSALWWCRCRAAFPATISRRSHSALCRECSYTSRRASTSWSRLPTRRIGPCSRTKGSDSRIGLPRSETWPRVGSESSDPEPARFRLLFALDLFSFFVFLLTKVTKLIWSRLWNQNLPLTNWRHYFGQLFQSHLRIHTWQLHSSGRFEKKPENSICCTIYLRTVTNYINMSFFCMKRLYLLALC